MNGFSPALLSKSIVLRLLGTVVLLLGAQASIAKAVECSPDLALIKTDNGILRFQVEVADDPDERAQGLMYRKSLPDGHGMLFIYETPRPAAFWMRNTLIPLDMIFFDETGTIRHIHRNARPHDETPIPGAAEGDPEPDRLMVLEISGGEADRNNLAVGQQLAHPALPSDRAALTCD